jgi:hypothetical protein
MIKMLEYLKNIKMTRSTISFIAGAIVILLFLKQCNSISTLKNEKAIAQTEANRQLNNLLATQDSVRVLVKENGGIVASKRTLEYTYAELEKNNAKTVAEFKSAMGDIKNLKNANSLLKTQIEILSKIHGDPANVDQKSDTTATITFNKDDDFGKGNTRKFNGKVEVSYIDKKFAASPGDFTFSQTIKLYAMTEKTNGVEQIRIATDYPGITFGEITNINLINNKLNKPTKKAGWSIGVGLGYGYTLSSGQVINLGPTIGVGLFYSPKWLRF